MRLSQLAMLRIAASIVSITLLAAPAWGATSPPRPSNVYKARQHRVKRWKVGIGQEEALGFHSSPPNAPPESSNTELPPSTVESDEPFRFYSPDSFWNMPLSPSAPLDTNSSAIVGAFNSLIESEIQSHYGPSINTTKYSIPIYEVPISQPTVKVTLSTPSAPALQKAWNAVPLPPDAHPAAGTDGVLVVWQPSTNELWEFWRLVHEKSGWHASWGGAMRHVSSDLGTPGPTTWPGAKPWWGASASSLGVVGGLITLEDLKLGVINHAVQMEIPNVRAGVYASPAQRTDGKSSDPLSLPEGAHLRLDPNLDLAALHLPRLTLMIAEAAQRYGIIVTNGAATVAFQAQDPTSTNTNPYTGPTSYFEDQYPGQLLASFPWSHLQLLKMELHYARSQASLPPQG